MHFILIVFFAIYVSTSTAQPMNAAIKGDVLVKVAPLSMANFEFPMAEVGVSYFFTDRDAIQLKYGHKIDLFANRRKEFKYDGFKMLAEVQHNVLKRWYLALEVGYSQDGYGADMEYYRSDQQSIIIEDQFDVHKRRIFFTAKHGFIVYRSQRIMFDAYAGLGFKHVDQTVSNLEYDPAKGHQDTIHYYEWFAAEFEDGDKTSLRAAFGINLNYRFKIKPSHN